MSLTCFEVAKATARNEPISQYLVNDEFFKSTIDINDICDVIKADIIYNRYKKQYKVQIFRDKIKREVEEALQHITEVYDNEDEELLHIVSILQYGHSYICKLVAENMDEIKRRLQTDKKLYDEKNIKYYERYYDYSFITNTLWNYRFTYACGGVSPKGDVHPPNNPKGDVHPPNNPL
jgi:hypothetical protein